MTVDHRHGYIGAAVLVDFYHVLKKEEEDEENEEENIPLENIKRTMLLNMHARRC